MGGFGSPVTMASVWLLPKRWMWSTASSMSATSSRVSSLAPYSYLGDGAGCRPSECAALSPPKTWTSLSRSAFYSSNLRDQAGLLSRSARALESVTLIVFASRV